MSFSDPGGAEHAFYSAFADLDIDRMRSVWSSTERISCIHPGGGLLQGTEAVIASWADIFRSSQPPQIVHRLIQASQDSNLVVHIVEEQIRSGDTDRRATVIATNVYGLLEDGWHMLAHHASLPLVEPQNNQRAPAALH